MASVLGKWNKAQQRMDFLFMKEAHNKSNTLDVVNMIFYYTYTKSLVIHDNDA